MPQIIKTMDEIMDEEKRDMFFIRFGMPFGDADEPSIKTAKQEHFAWSDAKGLAYAEAAPSGWLSGDPGIHAVYFDSPEDPRVVEYTATFENADGSRRDPNLYEMGLRLDQAWLDDGGPAIRAGSTDVTDW